MTMPHFNAQSLSQLSARWPTPIPIAAPHVPTLTRAMRRTCARIRLGEGDLTSWIAGDAWHERAAVLLYRMGMLSDTGLTDDGLATLVCDGVPTLAHSLAKSPGAGAAFLDAVTVARVAAPIGALPTREYRLGLSRALLVKELPTFRNRTDATLWRAAARAWLRDGGLLSGHRARGLTHLWPDSGSILERAVMIVGPRIRRLGA